MSSDEPCRNLVGYECKGKKRPAFLRALGAQELPESVTVNGTHYRIQETYKHDSWAATATYVSGSHTIVCKFNRQSPILFFPMRWVGIVLAKRETNFLKRLEGVQGIPTCYDQIELDGVKVHYVTSHDFVPGKPLSRVTQLRPDFFDNLLRLIRTLHDKRIAYVDLHKAENVIVGEDGLPYLIDFQISVWMPKSICCDWLFRIFVRSDLYHIEKHFRFLKNQSVSDIARPWWIVLHRKIANPWRKIRRRFLVLIKVRNGLGHASSEIATEIGLRDV